MNKEQYEGKLRKREMRKKGRTACQPKRQKKERQRAQKTVKKNDTYREIYCLVCVLFVHFAMQLIVLRFARLRERKKNVEKLATSIVKKKNIRDQLSLCLLPLSSPFFLPVIKATDSLVPFSPPFSLSSLLLFSISSPLSSHVHCTPACTLRIPPSQNFFVPSPNMSVLICCLLYYPETCRGRVGDQFHSAPFLSHLSSRSQANVYSPFYLQFFGLVRAVVIIIVVRACFVLLRNIEFLYGVQVRG